MTAIAVSSVSASQSQTATAASFDAALERAGAASEGRATAIPAAGDSLIEQVAGPDDGKTYGWGGSSLGQGRLDCPSSIDLNGDGRIGLDELLVAMGLTGTTDPATST